MIWLSIRHTFCYSRVAHRCWGIRSFDLGGSRDASSLWCFAADRSLGIARHLSFASECWGCLCNMIFFGERSLQKERNNVHQVALLVLSCWGNLRCVECWGKRNHSILVSNSLSRNPCADASPDFEESSGYGTILWRCPRIWVEIWVGLFVLIWIEMWNNSKAWLNLCKIQGDE